MISVPDRTYQKPSGQGLGSHQPPRADAKRGNRQTIAVMCQWLTAWLAESGGRGPREPGVRDLSDSIGEFRRSGSSSRRVNREMERVVAGLL